MTDFETKRKNRRTAAAILTESEVRVIKRMLGRKEATPRQLAQVYCVGVETIRKIDRGDAWAWVEDSPGVEEIDLAVASTPMPEGMRAAARASQERLLALGLPITQEDRLQEEAAKVLPKIQLVQAMEKSLRELAEGAEGRDGPEEV